MYEHRGYHDHANKFLSHGKGKDDLCMVVYLYQFTCVCRSKGSGKTEYGHPIGMFVISAAKIVTFVINLNLHFVF